MRTAIILPAHNVEQSVRDTLENLKPYQERVFFVDDGSSDHTREVIRKQGFHCISHAKKPRNVQGYLDRNESGERVLI